MAISYIGGKSRISSFITPFIPTDIDTYIEIFSGMYWVFLKMDLDKYPNLKTVVYNDYNSLNANLFKCIKNYDKLWDELSKYPCQQLGVENTPPEYEEMFNKFQKEVFDPNYIIGDEPNFDAACKYVYVLTQIFSGSKPETSKYTDYKGKYRCKVLIFMDKLKNPEYRKHFDKITFIENMDFEEAIKKYDSPTTYIYADPPYFSKETYYSNHDFDRNDHERLANVLKNIQGNFSLSYYDFPLLHQWYPTHQYKWKKKLFAKAAAAKKGVTQNMGEELLIMNYTLNEEKSAVKIPQLKRGEQLSLFN
jgi:DNA adenine methylase